MGGRRLVSFDIISPKCKKSWKSADLIYDLNIHGYDLLGTGHEMCTHIRRSDELGHD
jgi:hypothetical protein